MNIKSPTAILALLLLTVYSCKSQNKIISHKIEERFDSLYPSALNVRWENTSLKSISQQVNFDCNNCKEGINQTITFDTNGSILNKDILISEKDLPAGSISYIENNYPNGFKYGHINKNISRGGQISYQVDMLQTDPDGTPTSGGWVYVLKFSSSGEFISLEKRMSNL
jgi:hypothetical protein